MMLPKMRKMQLLPNTFRPLVNSLILTASTDPFIRGLDYLYGLRSLAIDPEMIDVMHDPVMRVPVATWIGENIDRINAELQILVQACDDCFHETSRPQIQIWAAPLADAYNICGLCNLQTQPITLLVDLGRVEPTDWLLCFAIGLTCWSRLVAAVLSYWVSDVVNSSSLAIPRHSSVTPIASST